MLNRAYDMQITEIEGLHGGEGKVIKKDLIKTDLPENVKMCAKLTLKSGCSIGFHKHEKDSEIFYILRGIAEYFDGNEKSKLSAGDSAIVQKGDSHSIANVSDEPLELLATIIK